ncbi:MAG: sigma-70 family RNA polymerase sigma factor [Planctomycetota bacterium]
MTPGDHELVAALRAREIAAYQLVYERLGAGLLRVALRILGNRADAEDAVQDAFLILYRRIDAFRGRSSLRTWMHRVLVNVALKQLVKRTADRATNADSVRPRWSPPAPSDLDDRSMIAAEVEALPLRRKLVFVLAEVEGLSHAEIARVLGLQESTVRYHLCRAKARLRERLRTRIKSG